MSCSLKHSTNLDKPVERSSYDMMMMEKYSSTYTSGYYANAPSGPSYHAAPWPMQRTDFDKNLQKKWCPRCGFTKEAYCGATSHLEAPVKENFCTGGCGLTLEGYQSFQGKKPANTSKTHQDPYNYLSYTH